MISEGKEYNMQGLKETTYFLLQASNDQPPGPD